ncbi:hypothetical protein WR25_24896 [Diploscapter pachys]|uniref:Uncharacterized protein n=1 Tax=Diploscapter pachys TaxID=2018661 RepID=A0A2A2LHR3_9BILA|nr:hypothetical protein WR25_24896 [Diploscapter pachys]
MPVDSAQIEKIKEHLKEFWEHLHVPGLSEDTLNHLKQIAESHKDDFIKAKEAHSLEQGKAVYEKMRGEIHAYIATKSPEEQVIYCRLWEILNWKKILSIEISLNFANFYIKCLSI